MPNEDFKDIPPESIYSGMISYFIHQDRLSWSRTQTIVVIEAAALAGAFARYDAVGIGGLVLATAVIWAIWQLILRDWEIRDQNLKLLDILHEPRNISMSKPPEISWRKGSVVLPWLIRALLLLNVVLITGLCVSLVQASGRIAGNHVHADVACSPYQGNDTTTIRVTDVELHLVINAESYYTFHYNKNDPMNPECLSLDFGKLCACDIKSQSVLLPLECSGNTSKDVTEIVFKARTLITDPLVRCPERDVSVEVPSGRSETSRR